MDVDGSSKVNNIIVSVIIHTYNRAQYIEGSIQSVLNQTFKYYK